MDISNLTGLEKPLTKLIETVGEGLGVVSNDIFKFDAKKVKRIGEAEAEIEKTKIIKKAEAESVASDILLRAGNRFALEQYNKQINLENIIFMSKEDLSGKTVNNESVSKDWASRFLGIAQDVSREDMQEILAKILSNEVQRPSTYSLRTLDVVRNLSSSEINVFKKFVAISQGDLGIFLNDNPNRPEFEKYGLDFSDYINLVDVGLFNTNTALSISMIIKSGDLCEFYLPRYKIIAKFEEERTININVIKFTEAGAQLADILKGQSKNIREPKYIEALKDNLTRQGAISITVVDLG